MGFLDDIDVTKLKELAEFLESALAPKPTKFVPGAVVVPTDMTVLESDDYSDFAANQFALTGRIEFTIVNSSTLLLVLSCDGPNLRVLCLTSGKLGRLNVDSVAEYQ